MLKKNRYLMPVIGLLILFCLCSYMHAQEVQLECGDECANQTTNLTNNAEVKEYIITNEIVKEIIESNQSDEDPSSEKSGEALAYREDEGDFRYAIDVVLKDDWKRRWKYSECDITAFSIQERLTGSCSATGKIYESRDGAIIFDMHIRGLQGACKYELSLVQDSGLPTEQTLNYIKNNLNDIHLIAKIYQYHAGERCPLERHNHHDQDKECGSCPDNEHNEGGRIE